MSLPEFTTYKSTASIVKPAVSATRRLPSKKAVDTSRFKNILSTATKPSRPTPATPAPATPAPITPAPTTPAPLPTTPLPTAPIPRTTGRYSHISETFKPENLRNTLDLASQLNSLWNRYI